MGTEIVYVGYTKNARKIYVGELDYKLAQILLEWDILDRVKSVIHDNEVNITSSIMNHRNVFVDRISCFAHKLQLTINKGLSTDSIKITTKVFNNIATFFHHSSVAKTELEKRRNQLGLQKHKLIQKNSTKWNSKFHMLHRLVEQRQAITAVLSDINIVMEKLAASLLIHELGCVAAEKLMIK